jgi:hypothetical protein
MLNMDCSVLTTLSKRSALTVLNWILLLVCSLLLANYTSQIEEKFNLARYFTFRLETKEARQVQNPYCTWTRTEI